MVEETVEEDEQDASFGATDEEAPIVKLVNRIFGDAVKLRASDIHVEVQRDTLRIRFRIDGLLRDVMTAPKRISTAVISRIKIISGLDISERRIPQDGRTRIMVDGMAIDCRISTLPSLHGEKVVIRLLTRGDDIPSLASLGFEPDQLEGFQSSLAVPQGLVLITGRPDRERPTPCTRRSPRSATRTRTSSRWRTRSRSSCPGSPRSA